MLQYAWEQRAGFHSILNAACTRVSLDSVSYCDENGVEHTLPADSIVVAAGMRTNTDEALTFANAADFFEMAVTAPLPVISRKSCAVRTAQRSICNAMKAYKATTLEPRIHTALRSCPGCQYWDANA